MQIAQFKSKNKNCASAAAGNEALGHGAPVGKREAVQALSKQIAFDASGILQVLDVRERKSNRKNIDVADVFSRYLAALEQVTTAVDRMLDSGNAGSS